MKIFGTKTSDATRRAFISALIWSLAAIAFYSYAFVMVFRENSRVAVLSGETQSLIKEKDTFGSLKDRVAQTASARGKLTAYFLTQDGVVAFLNRVQQLGTDNNLALKVNSVSVEGETVAPDHFENLKLSVEGTGLWQDVYRLASLIELMPFRVIIDTADFEKIEVPESAGSVSKSAAPKPTEWKVKLQFRVLKLK